jgi:hypothetical protein
MVRAGSFTESAGTVADSNPTKAQRVRAAVAVMALKVDSPDALKGVKWEGSRKKSPMVPRAKRGRSFRRVVQNWRIPASRTPQQFTAVRPQMLARAAEAPKAGEFARGGKKEARYPTKATEMAAFPAQMLTQYPHATRKAGSSPRPARV